MRSMLTNFSAKVLRNLGRRVKVKLWWVSRFCLIYLSIEKNECVREKDFSYWLTATDCQCRMTTKIFFSILKIFISNENVDTVFLFEQENQLIFSLFFSLSFFDERWETTGNLLFVSLFSRDLFARSFFSHWHFLYVRDLRRTSSLDRWSNNVKLQL